MRSVVWARNGFWGEGGFSLDVCEIGKYIIESECGRGCEMR